MSILGLSTGIIVLTLLLSCVYTGSKSRKYNGETWKDDQTKSNNGKSAIFFRNRRDVLQNPCETYGRCLENKGFDIPTCYCDKDCEKYNDCCFDYPNLSFTPVTLPENVVCDSVQFGYPERRRRMIGSYLISQCPSNYKDNNVAARCRDHLFPVSGKNGITYKNVYCAACHNVTDYKAWAFKFIYKRPCDKNTLDALNTSNIISKIAYITSQICLFSFSPPVGFSIRYCVLQHSINYDNVVNRTLCQSFSSPLAITNLENGRKIVFYKNVYCKSKSWKDVWYKCQEKEISSNNKFWGGTSMVGMFNVRAAVEGLGKQQCKQGDTYNAKYGACVDNCTGSSCEVEFIQNEMLNIRFIFVTNDTADADIFSRVISLILLTTPKHVLLHHCSVQDICSRNTTNLSSKCCVFNMTVQITISGQKTLSENEKLRSSLNALEWSYIESDFNRIVAVSSSPSDIKNCTINEEVVNQRSIQPTDIQRILSLLNNSVRNRNKIEMPNFFEAEAIILKNKTMELLNFKMRYHHQAKNELVVKNGSRISNWSTGTLMTYVTLSLSNIALFVTIIIYRKLNLAQSLSGKISIHMMGTLLVAQLVFTFADGANGIPVLCLIMGIISHYFWLSSFTWISIFLGHVLKTMQKMHSSLAHNKHGSRGNVLVFICGYFMPVTIVLPCAILDIFRFVHIGYAEGICFPTAYPANLFSFTLPIIISLIFNFIALITSSFFIFNFNNSSHPSMTVTNVKSLIPVYIRLSALCACPWLIGILADLLNSDVLQYTFIVLAGSQGTVVSVSFLSSRSVRTAIKRLFTRQDRQN